VPLTSLQFLELMNDMTDSPEFDFFNNPIFSDELLHTGQGLSHFRLICSESCTHRPRSALVFSCIRQESGVWLHKINKSLAYRRIIFFQMYITLKNEVCE